MKKRNFKFIGYVVGAVLFLAVPMLVSGENLSIGSKLFSIGPGVTYSRPNDADNGKWFGGVQARLHLSPSLAIEGSIAYRLHDFGYHTTIRTYPVQLSLLGYIMPGERWSPFLIGGAGWYYTRVRGPVGYSNTASRFGVHAGGGLEVMLNEFVSLDGSCRYVWLESVTSRDANALDKTFRDSGPMFTMAINFLF